MIERVTKPKGGYGSSCKTEIWRLLNSIIIPLPKLLEILSKDPGEQNSRDSRIIRDL